jgi:DNA-binding CsgD family transcriptional regulator
MVSSPHAITAGFNRQSVDSPLTDDSLASANARAFFEAVMEGFWDGILILTQQGEVFHANQRALELCNLLGSGACQSAKTLPPCLWSMCEQVIDGQQVFCDPSLVFTQTLDCIEKRSVRARVQWLALEAAPSPYLLVMLEDQTATARAAAMLESVQFGLTPRETEVWILRSINYSYEEIAEELFITLNTVKCHLKSVYAKRKEVLGEDADNVDGDNRQR